MGVAACLLSRTEDPRWTQRMLEDTVWDSLDTFIAQLSHYRAGQKMLLLPERAGWLLQVRKVLSPCHNTIPCLSQVMAATSTQRTNQMDRRPKKSGRSGVPLANEDPGGQGTPGTQEDPRTRTHCQGRMWPSQEVSALPTPESHRVV